LKTLLCQEASHPGHATTLTRSKWDYTGEDWVKYSPSIFNGGKFRFSFVPLDTWPLFQNGNFVLDVENPPKAVDLSLFEKGKICISWKDFAGKETFKKKADNTSEYRIRITDLKMAIEIGNANRNDPFCKRTNLGYTGITKIAKQAEVTQFDASVTFEKIKLPTSLLFFFLPKKVNEGGMAKYQDETECASGFRNHTLRSITVTFRDEELYQNGRETRFSHLNLHDAINLTDHWMYPVAGIPVDRQKMTLEHLLDDGTKYAFPHVYVRLSPGHQQRLIPSQGKIDQYHEPGNLLIDMQFAPNQIVDKDLMVVVYALYDDYFNVEADLKKKTYFNPILLKAAQKQHFQ
jgi:hypothetical protein